MGLAEAIVEKLKQTAADAREHYLAAIRDGATPEEILALASAAGVPADDVARDAAVLDEAATLAAAVGGLQELEGNAAAARGEGEAASATRKAEAARLEARESAAWATAKAAQLAFEKAAAALQRLATLYAERPDLLLRESAPQSLRALWEREAAREAALAGHKGCVEGVEHAEGALRKAETHFSDLKYGRVAGSRGDIEAAQKAVVDRESELKSARAALKALSGQ